jgi:hypothetical protein
LTGIPAISVGKAFGVAGGACALNTRNAKTRRQIDHVRFSGIPAFTLKTQYEY